MDLVINKNDDVSTLAIYALLHKKLTIEQKLGVLHTLPTVLIYDDGTSKMLTSYNFDKVAWHISAVMQTGAFENCLVLMADLIYLIFTNSDEFTLPELLFSPPVGNA